MKGKHQIKIIQAIEGGHVALSRKDGSYQVFRAFSAGDGAKLLEWVARELGVEVASPINLQGGLPASQFKIGRLPESTAELQQQLAVAPKPVARPPEVSTLRKPTRSKAEKQQQFVDLVRSRGNDGSWVRLTLREIYTALAVSEPTAHNIASDAVDLGLVEKRIVKGDRPEDRGRSYSEWRVAVQQAQPAEGESGHQATADEPKTVAAPPAPEVPPEAQAVKLEVPAVGSIPPVIFVPAAQPERLPDGVDGDPGLEKRARKVLLCLQQIAERQGQQQFEVQLTKLAEKAGVPKPSMPAILPVLRAEHDVIVNEPLQRGWGWRFDLSRARAA